MPTYEIPGESHSPSPTQAGNVFKKSQIPSPAPASDAFVEVEFGNDPFGEIVQSFGEIVQSIESAPEPESLGMAPNSPQSSLGSYPAPDAWPKDGPPALTTLDSRIELVRVGYDYFYLAFLDEICDVAPTAASLRDLAHFRGLQKARVVYERIVASGDDTAEGLRARFGKEQARRALHHYQMEQQALIENSPDRLGGWESSHGELYRNLQDFYLQQD